MSEAKSKLELRWTITGECPDHPGGHQMTLDLSWDESEELVPCSIRLRDEAGLYIDMASTLDGRVECSGTLPQDALLSALRVLGSDLSATQVRLLALIGATLQHLESTPEGQAMVEKAERGGKLDG